MADQDTTIRRNLVPRGVRAKDAAAYIGVSPSKFHELVKTGRMPPPGYIDRLPIWALDGLDAAFDKLIAAPTGEDSWSRKIAEKAAK
jgi:hypothetical protein